MQAGIIPFRMEERALNPLEIRIERALQHSGLGIGIYEVDAAYRFFLYGSVLLSSAIMVGGAAFVQHIPLRATYVLTAF